LHGLRHDAYGIGKRSYDDKEVVWPGNLTALHEPKIIVDDETTPAKYTIYFHYDTEWRAVKIDNDIEFIWSLD